MKIYFSHSKSDYNTEYELDCLEYIRAKYPHATIINPKDIKIDPEDLKSQGYPAFIKLMQKYYFCEIDKCDLLIVAKSKSGKFGSGVKKEIEYVEQTHPERYRPVGVQHIPIEYLQIPYPIPNRPTMNCYWCKKQILEKDICGEDEFGDGRTYGCACAECAGV